MKRSIIAFCSLIISIMFCASLYSETVYLKDKTSINGTVIGFKDTKFLLKKEDGQKLVLQKADVEKIVFTEPEEKTVFATSPAQNFSSPVKTFLYWKTAAERGELEKMAECFVVATREDQLTQLKNFSKADIKKMSTDTKKTKFSIGNPLYDGSKAYLSVVRKKGKSTSTEILQFEKEQESWKIFPE